MQRLLYSIFISFFLILSCAKSKPKDIISERKMTEVLTKVSIVDGYLNTLPSDSAMKVMPVMYEKIFAEFGLDSNKFVRNLDYYFADPNLTDKLYLNVGNKLQEYDRKINREDSIRQVFVQDSINRQYYMQRMHERQMAIRHFNLADTGYNNFYAFNRRALQESNLSFLNYFMNLSTMQSADFSLLDSIRSGKFNELKYSVLYSDTTAQNNPAVSTYNVDSEKFLHKLGINLSQINTFVPQSRTGLSDELFDRRNELENAPPSRAPQPAEEFMVDTANLQLREDQQIDDRMVKPVIRRGAPQ